MTALDFLAAQVEALLKENFRLQDENAALTARLKEAETLASAAAVLLEVQRVQLDALGYSMRMTARVQPTSEAYSINGGHIPSEKHDEAEIKRHIRASGGWVEKLHADGVQGKGTLDLLGSYRGRPFLVKFKAESGKPTPTQTALVRRARQGGFVSGVVASVAEFEGLFDMWLDAPLTDEQCVAGATQVAVAILGGTMTDTMVLYARLLASAVLTLTAQRDLQRAQLDAFVKAARGRPDPDGGLREGGQ